MPQVAAYEGRDKISYHPHMSLRGALHQVQGKLSDVAMTNGDLDLSDNRVV